MLIDQSFTQLLDAFSSSDPTPGGGSASALAAAVGAALLAMVAGLPKTRGGTDEDRTTLGPARDVLLALRNELATLVDRDTSAYDQVVAAYRLPKTTDEEKAARSAAIQRAMRQAIDTPLAVMRACEVAARHGEAVARHGNPSASSDVQVGLELLGAGLRGARLNVEINLGSVKDEAYVARVKHDVETLAAALDGAIARGRTLLA
jgi:formiminotetrahydrofolate cyclodeaminase